jgi:uncharacterized membrane protein YdfJ with MMPL/SSD domain
MLTALADRISRHPRRVLALVLAFAVVAGVVGGPVPGKLVDSTTSFEDPSSQSVQARHLLQNSTGRNAAPDVVLLVRDATPARVTAARALLKRDPDVAEISPAVRSKDGSSAYVAATFYAGGSDAKPITRALRQLPGAIAGGPAVASEEISSTVKSDLARAELYAFPLLFLLSLLIFRGLVAALLPPLVGGVTIVGTFLVMRAVNTTLPLSIFAVNLVTGMGLGLAIDYSLFILARYREELVRVGPGREALVRTLTTAGRTVLFSGLTVSAALASLTVFPQRFLYSMGISGAIAALIAIGVSLVGLSALLAVLGTRVNALSPARLRRRLRGLPRSETGRPGAHGSWYRLSRAVMKRPIPIAAGSAALLIALGLPFLGIRFTGVDASALPPSASARQVDEAIRTEFPPAPTSPVVIAVRAPAGAAPQLVAYAGQLRTLGGAAAVIGPAPAGPGLWRLDVIPRDPPLSSSAKQLVHEVRALPTPYVMLIGGETAGFLDQQSSLRAHLPIVLAILIATTLILLFLATDSVVLPIKSLVMNLLSLSAAFGILVWIFQDGHLQGLLDYTSQGALESTQPILLFVIAFALSTDYGVFLLTRIKEHHDAGEPNREAVPHGLESTGPIVTSAALLFTVAIGAFSTSHVVFIKELGVGTALAVLIDASIVRALLVPSLMELLGEWNWWAPRSLRRLHARLGLG